MPITEQLRYALDSVESAAGEVSLDFSSERRVDAAALRMMETLAGTAGGRGVKVVLHGVNIDIYKTLKLVKLAPRFSFEN